MTKVGFIANIDNFNVIKKTPEGITIVLRMSPKQFKELRKKANDFWRKNKDDKAWDEDL